jgi:hypothetical protein
VRPEPVVRLDPTTVREVLGRQPDPQALASLQLDVLQEVARLEAEIASGRLASRPLLVRGRPLGDWLPLDEVARLLLMGKDRRRGL